FKAGKVLQLEYRIRMRKARARDLRIVLRTNRQENASLTQSKAISLKGGVRLGERRFLSDLDLVESVVSDDSAPQCVIQIEHQTLFRLAEHRANHRGKRLRDGKAGLRCGQDFVAVPAVPIEPPQAADPGRDGIQILNQQRRAG